MTDSARFDLLASEVALTIATQLPFRIMKPPETRVQMSEIHRHALLPSNRLETQLTGIKMGRAFVVDIVKKTGQTFGEPSLTVCNAVNRLVATWRRGPRSFFADPDGGVILGQDWSKSSVGVLRALVASALDRTPSGEAVGYVFDPQGIAVEFGASQDWLITSQSNVRVMERPGFDPSPSHSPIIIGLRYRVVALPECCVRIVKG